MSTYESKNQPGIVVVDTIIIAGETASLLNTMSKRQGCI